MESNEVLLTVIVPSYNHEKYILECIESIYAQTYKGFQWIIVDDGSTDSTPQLLKDNQNNYNYELILKKNEGLANTLNFVLKQYAKGKYYSICASDDYWPKDKIEKQLSFMLAHPEYALSYGKSYEVDLNSNILGIRDSSKYKSGYIFEDIILQRFHPKSYMISKSAVAEIGYYKPGIIAEDFYMNCMLSYKFQLGYLPEILCYYRVDELSKKRDPFALYMSHKQTIDMFEKHKIYSQALSYQYLREFEALSLYKKYKIQSIKSLFKVKVRYIRLGFIIRGCYHLLFKWI